MTPAILFGVWLVARTGMSPASQAATISAVADPAVAGVSEYVQWSAIEAVDGQPDYTAVDAFTPALLAAGKPVNVALIAGGYAPAWLSSYGVASATFVNSLPIGPGQYECQTSTEYTPWDGTFQARYMAALQGLVAHLQAQGLEVAGVELSGLNHLTAEFHMEAQTKTAPGSGCMGTDATALWQAVGYQSGLMEGAAATIYAATAQAFPGAALSFPYIDANELPLIGPKGQTVSAAKVAGYLATVLAGAVAEGAVTQYNDLATGAAIPADWQAGGALQTTPWFSGNPGNPCAPATVQAACSDADFGALLQSAIAAGASRIEVWGGDFEYEDQILAADQALLGAHARSQTP